MLFALLHVSLLAGASGALLRSQRGNASSHDGAKYAGKTPFCLANTGMKCAANSDCKEQVACSKDGKCTCASGCADTAGACKRAPAKWLDTELRIAASADTHQFLYMPMNGGGPPKLKEGYPSDHQPESLWHMLIQDDGKSMLLTTKQSKFLDDGFFLDLPPSPWPEDKFIPPVQAKPDSAGQAEWQMEQGPKENTRIRHVASDRYLMVQVFKKEKINIKHAVPVKEEKPILTTCAAAKCLAGATDFDIWPKTEHPVVKPKYEMPRAPWENAFL